MIKQEAKQKIQKLIEKYEQVLKLGELNKYSEEQTKINFILPLFEALGWNILEKNDKKIDEEVYKLYCLTPAEIKIVEE